MEDDDVIGAIYLDQDSSYRSFEIQHLERLKVVSNLVAAKINQAQTRNEMELAGYIQTRLLPQEPKAPPGYETAFRLEPFHRVGGDFYETRELPDGRYLIAFGDVVGNGVPAALIMSNVLAAIRALAPSTATPLELAERVTDLAREQLCPTEFVTLFIGFLDPVTHRLRYCNAGHELPALFLPDGTLTRLQATAPAVGHIRIPFQGDTVDVPPGALVCVWSDGITEACRPGAEPEMFTEERLLGVLKQVHRASPSEIVATVFDRVNDFLCGTHARDDRAILLVRRDDAEPM